MTTIPLIPDHDSGLDSLLDYDQVINGKKKENNVKRAKSRIDVERALNLGSVALANISIRLGFLRKVFGILSFQLLTTAVICIILYLVPNVRGFLQQHPSLIIGALISSFVLLFALYMNSQNVPINYLLLTTWTLVQSFAVAFVVSFYNVEVVIEATGLTAIVVVSLFIFTLQSKRDFQKYYAILFSFLMVFFIASFIQFFLQSPAFNFLMAVLGAGLFSVYLVIDIDRVMHHSSPEDYIDACVSLYLDIINLFLRILQIINELNRN